MRCGSSIFDAFEREIARPIGMQDYRPTDGEYVTGGASVYPAYPFKMSARDLARFALLYLRKGQWQGRQIVPARWVDESVKPYSSSEWGPGYGYLWWIAPINNSIAPIVNLPKGTFFAQGAGGQYAVVIPDSIWSLCIAQPTRTKASNLRQIGRLLWLVLDAGRFPDIGPDASIESAEYPRAPATRSPGCSRERRLLYGETAKPGPYRIRLNADGSAAVLRGNEPTQLDTGSWSVREDQLCREWKKIEPRQLCFAAASDGSRVQLFDRMGVMFIDARIVDQ